MKNIEISDITAAVNKKESLNNSLFLINNIGGDGQNNNEQDENQFLMQPISTTVYSNKKELKKNKIEVINEIQETNSNNNEADKQEKEINLELRAQNTESLQEISINQNNVPSPVKNTHSEYISSSLGQSIILLLNSNNKALVSAIDLYKKSSFIKSPLTAALQNIDKYIRNDNTGNAMTIIYNPLKEMILKKKSNSNNSFKILNWLFFNASTNKQLNQLLLEEIKSDNKKSKLVVIQIYKNIIEEQSHSLKKKEDITSEDIEIWKGFSEIYMPLVDIIQNNGIIDKDGNILPTLLTTLTYQVIISIFTSNSNIIINKNQIKSKPNSASPSPSKLIIEDITNKSFQDYDFYPIYWKSVHCLSCSLGCLISWDQKKYPLFDTTLNEILDFVNTILLKKDEDPSKENEIADVIAKLWININPYLSNKYIKNPVEKTRKIVEKIIDEENEDFGYFGSLLKLSLILGHQSKENFIGIFKSDSTKEKFLNIVSSNILNGEFVAGRNLGFYVLRKFLFIDGPERFKSMVDQLLIMLGQDDSVSKASIGFLAEYATYLPEDVLPNIFLKLDSKNPVERMNSLFIIYEIFQLNQDILKSSVHTRLRSVLTEQLLLRINDEDIKLRNEAMLLFCYLDQNEIIPKLAIKLIDSNEKVRAASEAALLNTLLKHKSSVDVIFTYIEYIRSLNQENREKNIPMTPGQINSTYIKDNGPEYTKEQKEKLLERQFRVVRKWAKELATNSWLYIIDPLLKKVYASPEDQILVKFMSTISEFLIETPVVLTIFKQITKLMIEQPKLTEDLLNRNDEESSIIVKDILFLRISPLLVLRVLPNKAFDKLDISKTYNSEVLNKAITKKSDKDENEDEDENEEFNLDDMKNDEIIYLLFKELIQRIEQIYEFDQVRKLSVEILASLPIQYIFPYLKYVFEDGNKTKDLMQLKSYLYCLCNVVIKHSVEELEFTKFIDFSFHIPLEILITYSKDLNTKNKAIQNIQMGCIECLSLMICSFIKTLPGEEEEQKVLIKEIEEIEKDSNSLNKDSKEKISSFEQVVYALLQLLSPQRLQKMVISSDKFGKTLPKSFQPIVESLYIIQKQTQPLIFEILSISIANIFTTTIRHYSKEIENVSTTVNPTQSSPSNQTNPTSSPPPANSTPLSDEDCRKNIHSLYKFATQYLYYPLLDIVQEGILYHSSKEIQGNNLGILQEQLHDTLTCACLQVLYHLVYYLRDGKFKERELEDVLNVCLNGLGCDKSMIRESSLKLFSGLLSCNYNEPNASQNTTNKLNLNIVNHDTPIIASPLAALNYISSNNQEQASDINYVTHGLFSQGKHSLELIKAKHAIQQIAEMEEVSTSTPTLSLARKLIVLMNTY